MSYMHLMTCDCRTRHFRWQWSWYKFAVQPTDAQEYVDPYLHSPCA